MVKVAKIMKWGKLIVLCLFISVKGAIAQQNNTSPLDRLVSIEVKNATVDLVLDKIALQGGFSFSYSPALVRKHFRVTCSYVAKPVSFILDRLFNSSVIAKVSGNYIILQPSKEEPVIAKKKEKIMISGYVSDRSTLQNLPYVSIYESTSLCSAISDKNGYFNLMLPNTSPTYNINISRTAYMDTAIRIDGSQSQALKVSLNPEAKRNSLIPTLPIPVIKKDSIIVGPDTNTQVKRVDFLVPSSAKINARNIKDTFFRVAQFSLFPPLSTNKLISGNVVNNFSLNLFIGYSHGVNGVELGGFLNIDRGEVKYVQLAGFFNIVGGNVIGVQGAGFANLCTKSLLGFQGAGFVNYAKSVFGVQGAGFLNVAFDTVRGAQAAGAVNFCQELYGLQASGLINIARYVKKGVQIAPFNFSDSCNGVPIGIFSFVKKGYHKIEVSYDNLSFTTLSFRTGTSKFHNIISIGALTSSTNNQVVWSTSYGIGTTAQLVKKLNLDVDLSATHYMNVPRYDSLLSINSQVYLGVEWQIFKKLSIAAGPTLNIYINNSPNVDFVLSQTDPQPAYFHSEKIDNTNYLKAWLGYKVALRFL